MLSVLRQKSFAASSSRRSRPRLALGKSLIHQMQPPLKHTRKPQTPQLQRCNSIRIVADGRSLPPPVERFVLTFCDLGDLGEMLAASKAMCALVDSHLQLLQALEPSLVDISAAERRLFARVLQQTRSLTTFAMRPLVCDDYRFSASDNREREIFRFVVNLVRANEGSLEVFRLEPLDGWEDDDYFDRSYRTPSIDTMPQLFEAAARCRKLREFVAPFDQRGLRAKNSLMLPSTPPHQRPTLRVDFDQLFKDPVDLHTVYMKLPYDGLDVDLLVQCTNLRVLYIKFDQCMNEEEPSYEGQELAEAIVSAQFSSLHTLIIQNFEDDLSDFDLRLPALTDLRIDSGCGDAFGLPNIVAPLLQRVQLPDTNELALPHLRRLVDNVRDNQLASLVLKKRSWERNRGPFAEASPLIKALFRQRDRLTTLELTDAVPLHPSAAPALTNLSQLTAIRLAFFDHLASSASLVARLVGALPNLERAHFQVAARWLADEPVSADLLPRATQQPVLRVLRIHTFLIGHELAQIAMPAAVEFEVDKYDSDIWLESIAPVVARMPSLATLTVHGNAILPEPDEMKIPSVQRIVAHSMLSGRALKTINMVCNLPTAQVLRSLAEHKLPLLEELEVRAGNRGVYLESSTKLSARAVLCMLLQWLPLSSSICDLWDSAPKLRKMDIPLGLTLTDDPRRIWQGPVIASFLTPSAQALARRLRPERISACPGLLFRIDSCSWMNTAAVAKWVAEVDVAKLPNAQLHPLNRLQHEYPFVADIASALSKYGESDQLLNFQQICAALKSARDLFELTTQSPSAAAAK